MNAQKPHDKSTARASERRAIAFLVVKVAVFVITPLLAAAIAVYVLL